MADVKKVILVHKDGTTEEFDRFIGTFIDDNNNQMLVKNIASSEAALAIVRMNWLLNKTIENSLKEEC